MRKELGLGHESDVTSGKASEHLGFSWARGGRQTPLGQTPLPHFPCWISRSQLGAPGCPPRVSASESPRSLVPGIPSPTRPHLYKVLYKVGMSSGVREGPRPPLPAHFGSDWNTGAPPYKELSGVVMDAFKCGPTRPSHALGGGCLAGCQCL